MATTTYDTPTATGARSTPTRYWVAGIVLLAFILIALFSWNRPVDNMAPPPAPTSEAPAVDTTTAPPPTGP